VFLENSWRHTCLTASSAFAELSNLRYKNVNNNIIIITGLNIDWRCSLCFFTHQNSMLYQEMSHICSILVTYTQSFNHWILLTKYEYFTVYPKASWNGLICHAVVTACQLSVGPCKPGTVPKVFITVENNTEASSLSLFHINGSANMKEIFWRLQCLTQSNVC